MSKNAAQRRPVWKSSARIIHGEEKRRAHPHQKVSDVHNYVKD